MKLQDLKPNPENPRTIDKESFDRLKGKIQRNPDGLTANKIVHKDGTIIAGNQRWRAITELKLELKDDWFKDVSGWTAEQIREYLVVSNISDGDWNWDTLLNEYEPTELSDWGLEVPDWKDDTEVEEDEAPEVSKEPAISQLGEVYQLGRHRVMCGDSTDKASVESLMAGAKADMVFTDPPYGMDLDTDYTKMGSTAKKHDKVIGDNIQFNAEPLLDMFDYCNEIFLWGADYYVETLARQYPNLGSWIIWDKYSDKERTGLLDGRFGSTFETCWSKTPHKREIARVLVTTNYTARGDEERKHPTQKPVALACWFLQRWAKDKTNIVDLFLGSGSTLIACEQTDRICFGMELDPKYVDVIRKRYAKYTNPDTWESEWETLTPAITVKEQ